MASVTDLHMHSDRSDGLMTPAEVVSYAAERGVRLMALTDHDTVAGLADAACRAAETGVRLVSGVEISASWGADSLHVVGLGFDPGNPELIAGLEQQQARRQQRAEEICEKLARRGIDGALQGVREARAGGLITRTHIARYLVEAGHVRDIRQAFRKHLGAGKRAHVTDHWAPLETVVDWIRGAGGVAVLAHPARYRLSRRRMLDLLGEFKESGGEALEVVSGCHSDDENRTMLAHARDFQLLASSGSDFHVPGLAFRQPGQVSPLPDEIESVWQHYSWYNN